ncbi:Protein phosphatase CheZ [Georgfuchsia toluolica]|uniref:Protein phosphatase CheZ n=1 Tax=Georgfuchsia toluolica TaxID=424218 RepID=A0A916J1C3_9PROT|nr:protein phosphatase CheZ [Georgfuchsia toluolica]CAG4882148.1 Protein phosphatase CheZ [Georgfuchsia toluolica]
MADLVNTSKAGDSAELEALFETVLARSQTSVAIKPADFQPDASSDSVGGKTNATARSVVPQGELTASPDKDRVFNKLGLLARQLHDTLRELGYNNILEKTASKIPDARQRLAYIAQMTEQAASRVLNATDAAKPLQDEMLASSEVLSARWNKAFANELAVEEFKRLAEATRDYFRASPDKHRATNGHLMEIMMAQDFQDLTGQVIKRVVELAQEMEDSLVSLLIEAIPAGHQWEKNENLLNGPALNAEGRSDVMSSQSQVDDLLESLGF